MKLIGHKDIIDLHLNPAQMWDWVDDALRHKSEMLMPAKISINSGEDRFWNTMPIVMPSFGIAGVKLVNRYPNRKPALDAKILLYSTKDGKPLAILDGNYITAMRTGAVAAHSADILGRSDFTKVTMIGLGNTMRATMLVMLARHPERSFNVHLVRYKDQHEQFAQRFSSEENVHFTYHNTLEEAVQEAEIVFSAVTVFHEDVLPPSAFNPGTTLIPIHTRGFMKCDLAFDRIYGDETSQIEHFTNFERFPNFAEVADVLNGTALGRTSQQERILVYNIGIAAHDFYFAQKIFNAESHLPEVDLTEPQGKFWL